MEEVLEFALDSHSLWRLGGSCVFFLWAIVYAPLYQGFGL